MPPIIRDDRDKKCFIIMPISTPDNWLLKYSGDKIHFIHVLNHLLTPAIKKAGFEPIPPKTRGSELIHGEIIKNIESADLVLCDMSILNPNVFFELGIRTSLNKPVCIIKDDLTENVPFDTSIINNYTYLSALAPWTLDSQIEDLSNHIKDSFEKSRGSNSLWKYFGLSSTAQPIKEESTDAKIDFLIKQFEVVREQLIKPPLSSGSIPTNIIADRINQIISSTGVSVESVIWTGKGSLDVTFSKYIHSDLISKIFDILSSEFGIMSANWHYGRHTD